MLKKSKNIYTFKEKCVILQIDNIKLKINTQHIIIMDLFGWRKPMACFKRFAALIAAICAVNYIYAQEPVSFDMKDAYDETVFYNVTYDEQRGGWKWTSEQADGFQFNDYGFFIRKDRISFAVDDIDDLTKLIIDPDKTDKKFFIVDREGIRFNNPDNYEFLFFKPVDQEKYLDAYYQLWFLITKGQAVPPPRGTSLWGENEKKEEPKVEEAKPQPNQPAKQTPNIDDILDNVLNENGNNNQQQPVNKQNEQKVEQTQAPDTEEKPKVETPAPKVISKVIEVNFVKFVMVYVEGGKFNMGATPEQGYDAQGDEKPVHNVTLDNYYIGQTEVTQELWEAVMGYNPSKFVAAKNPVESITFKDVKKFIKKLNKLTGYFFMLPTEAEWEYAARGGKYSKKFKYAGSNKADDVAWCSLSTAHTYEVATKRPNELQLFDMSGNVAEMCNDWYGPYEGGYQVNPQGAYDGVNRVNRGGSWGRDDNKCRVSTRANATEDFGYERLGFRLVLKEQ